MARRERPAKAQAGGNSRRGRWMPLGILVIVLGLVAAGLGGYLLRTAHAVHAVEIDGTIADYREITINGSYARNELKLVGDPHTYTLDRTQYHPALPARLLQSGRAQVWIDQGTTAVVALTLYDELGLNPVKYTTGAYDNPLAFYYATETAATIAIAGGGALVVIAALWLLFGGLKRRGSARAVPQPATVREVPQPAFEPRAGRIPAIPAVRPPAPALAAPAVSGAGQEAAGGRGGPPPYAGLPAQPSTPRSALEPPNAPVPWPGPNSGPSAPQPNISGPAFQWPAPAGADPFAPYPAAPAASNWGTSGAPPTPTPTPPTSSAPLAGTTAGPFAQSPVVGASGPFAPQPPAGADRPDPWSAASNSGPGSGPSSGPSSGPGAPSWEAFDGPAAPQPGSAAEPPAVSPYPIPTPAQAAPTIPAPQRSRPLGQAPGSPSAPAAAGAGGAANPATPAAPGGWADGFATPPPSTSMRPPGLRPIGQPDERPASGPPSAPAQAGGSDVAELPTEHTPSVPPTAPPHGDLSDFPTERIPAAPSYEPGSVLDDDGGHR